MFDSLVQKFVQPLLDFGPRIPKLLLGILIGIVSIKIAIEILRYALKLARVPKSLIDIVDAISSLILWVLLFAEILKYVGFSSAAIAISSSLVFIGFALANGATSLTSDIISAFYIAKDRDFEIGFRIKTGDVEGIIEKIDVRKVRILSDDGKLHVVPNANLDKNGWTVLNRNKDMEEVKKRRFISFKRK